MRKLIVFIVIIVFVENVFGQSTDQVFVPYHHVIMEEDTSKIAPGNVAAKFEKIETNKADKLYDRFGFIASANHYSTIAKKQNDNIQVLSRMANSFRMNGQTEEAEYWYSRFIGRTQDSIHYLHYAEILKNNNNCESAKIWFEKYRTSLGETQLPSINDCSTINDFRTYDQFQIENVRSINTKSDDFCAIPFQGGILLTSNREVKRTYKSHDHWTGESFTDLFFAEQTATGDFKNVKPLSGNLNTPLHEGVASINTAGSFMIFTRNEKQRSGEKQLKELKLYSAYKGEDGYWSDAKKLCINEEQSSSCHPSLAPDNMKIYFSSNRIGGYGGFDLYVSDFENGEWAAPRNLGPKVNSSANELFPFIDADGTLYFSSNGHSGLGGLDVFMVKSQDTFWTTPQHLGLPINSSKDDFGFYVDHKKSKGYFSSNRSDGKGKDDIYSFKVNGKWPFEQKYFMVRIFTYEKETDMPLPGVEVTIKEKLTGKVNPGLDSYWITEQNGAFYFKVKRENSYLFEFKKDGYIPIKKYKTTGELLQNASFGLMLAIDRYRDFKLLLSDPQVAGKFEASIKNLSNGEVIRMPFSQLGEVLANLECGSEYEIDLIKDGEVIDTMHLKLPENCDQQETGELVFKTIKNPTISNQQFEVSNQLPSDENPEKWTKEMFKKYFLGDDATNFEAGQVITLRDVFYDFDRHEIRSDASLDLERVAALMKQFPNIRLSLEAHTDHRGTLDYNNDLSERRAISARDYLIYEGVSADRLMSKGYGEERPRIDCKQCTDVDHQLNRRTEIRIIEF